ncbi:PTS glucose transporter subunit IIA [Paludicola sp. MB14-C6]|uniref:PTS sugar transporter subunit IIA n=1 Tax=Paludihabitans sp. MB14-C6 TaxID=3070656 RepID=UPI0027DC51B4|nr:PTS glucose transporter subunit IIA [Paludicola sp. MB14-C6]WMJ23988.1 PTS glucose transporter subunit IIA [Paludicola sp. MB14-C6]
MFGLFKKKENEASEIFATQNGTAIALTDVPDEVFSEKMLGDGIAIIPTSNEVVSPVNGTIIDVTETLHAYCIATDDGLEILIHIGVDTVELKGEGFESFVKANDKVKVGDKLATVDLDFIKSKGYQTHTPIIITNMQDIKEMKTNLVQTQQAKTVVMTYKK